ncbi:MAG: hypothetical protein AB1631_32305 [Acidobacteriota bacterium]
MNCKRTLLALVITALLLSPMQAMSAGADSRTIEGIWEVTVNLNDPNLPPSFEALETYSRGGGFITSNNMPFLTRVGQGAWEKVGNQYFVKIKFFKFDENGLHSGTITVTHTVTLNGKDEYTGAGTAVLCGPDGTTCLSVDFDTVGRRLTAEP